MVPGAKRNTRIRTQTKFFDSINIITINIKNRIDNSNIGKSLRPNETACKRWMKGKTVKKKKKEEKIENFCESRNEMRIKMIALLLTWILWTLQIIWKKNATSKLPLQLPMGNHLPQHTKSNRERNKNVKKERKRMLDLCFNIRRFIFIYIFATIWYYSSVWIGQGF